MIKVALLGLVSLALAQKTILFPDPPGLSVLEDYPLPTVSTTSIEKWEPGVYPEWCWDQARTLRDDQDIPVCAPANIEVYNVTYSDCTQYPWTLCRCTDAQISLDDEITAFGQNPPGIRSYVRHIMVLDGTTATGSISKGAGSNDDVVAIVGPCTQTVYLHETFHSVDAGFHDTANFSDAQAADTCTPDAYSETSPAELFAQLGVVYTYDVDAVPLVQRGINASCMDDQLKAVGDYVGTRVKLDTSACFARRPNSPVVTPVVEAEALVNMKVEVYENPIVMEWFD